jgi:hypothetical protein
LLVQRAEAANFPELRGHCLADYCTDPAFQQRLGKSPEDGPAAARKVNTAVWPVPPSITRNSGLAADRGWAQQSAAKH